MGSLNGKVIEILYYKCSIYLLGAFIGGIPKMWVKSSGKPRLSCLLRAPPRDNNHNLVSIHCSICVAIVQYLHSVVMCCNKIGLGPV